MGIALVALLAFGGTYAYFTASASTATGSATTGLVSLAADNTTIALTATPVPGDTIFDGTLAYTNASTVDTIVYVQFGATFAGQTVGDVLTITTGATGGWAQVTGHTDTYWKKVTASTNDTFPVSIVFKDTVTENNAQADSSALTYMGKAITVTVNAASIQYANLTGADDAAKAAAGYSAVTFAAPATNSASNN